MLPYQMPPRSKAYLLGDMTRERLFTKPQSAYDELVLTTGSAPIRLPAAIGGGLSGVYCVRIHRLLIIGALTRVRWAIKNGRPKGSWLEQMLERKPRMLLAIDLANKTARTIWPMMTKHEDYRDPIAAV
jgi:hypothetical protein